MKTIESRQIHSVESNNGKHIGTTTVWNVHSQYGCLAQSKNSNGYKFVANYFKKNPQAKKVCVTVGAKGWSQHSASELVMFDISKMSESDIKESWVNDCSGFTNIFEGKEF